MIASLILILIGLMTLLLGVGGTVKARIEGIGGLITITISGAAGIVLIVIGALLLSVPP